MVCWYVSPVALYGTATNYSKIAWGTGGDGYFADANSLTTSYFPGIHDKTSGSVALKMLVVPIAPCVGNLLCSKNIVLDPCTGIKEATDKALSMVIQPNPAHSNVLITINNPPVTATLNITGMDGRTIHSTPIDSQGKQTMTVQEIGRAHV